MAADSTAPSLDQEFRNLTLQEKRVRFTKMAQEAEEAMEKAAKKIKLAKSASQLLAEAHPDCHGAEDAAMHMDDMNKKAAVVWAEALEGKTILQDMSQMQKLRERQRQIRRADRQRVAEVMGLQDPGFPDRLFD